MKRLLPLTLLSLALAVPSVALAQQCSWRTDPGSGADKITATGSCAARKSLFSLTLSCGGDPGSVTARYDFTLPKDVTGSVDKKVSFRGTEPTVKLTRVDNKVSVYVTRTAGNSRSTTIQMVSISYYRS
jgi:hypothetical protein